MNELEFLSALQTIEIFPTKEQLNQLETYYELLVLWNQKMNLTGITDKKEVYLKHFYDSLTLATVVDFNQEVSLCDIGSGAGFPGIVLKIMFPQIKVTLLDALQKRVIFLNTVIQELNLKDIEAIHTRAEDYVKCHCESFDYVTARAVAKLNILMEYAIPALKLHGKFIAMKGNVTEELKESASALNTLHSKVIVQKEFLLPIEKSQRNLIVIEKLGKTNPLYPRKFDKINKNPL